MPTTVTDKSGNNHTGTPYNGVGFDTEYKAFTFDGVNDYIRRDGIPTPTGSGNFLHTVSMWFKLDSLATTGLLWGMAGETDGTDGTPSDSSLPHAFVNTSGAISWAMWANDAYTSTGIIQAKRWYHCVWTYSGGTNGRKLFLDGIEQILSGGVAALNMVNATSRLAIGIYPHNLSSNPLKGSVANFRLFNRALSQDEIYQLYAYQKEEFGHSTNNLTLKAGRLGIGTSEPRAALDVRGVIRGPGLTIQTVSSYKSDTTIFAGTSVTDISGLSVTIQPKFANSKILVSYDVNMSGKGRVYLRVKRVQGSNTSYFWADQGSGDWTQSPGGGAATSTFAGANDETQVHGFPFKHLDNVDSLNPITYTVQGWTNHSVYNVCINRGFVDTSAAGYGGMGYWGRCVSSITAQEVCQ